MFDIPPPPNAEGMKVGGKSAGKIVSPHVYAELSALGLWLAAAIAALLYGVVFLRRPPSIAKTIVKVLPVALLAVGAIALRSPLFLIVGLTLSAAGDGFLAGEPKRWLPFGLAAFLAAHLAYVTLFLTTIVDAMNHLLHGMPSDMAYTLGPATIGMMAISAVAAIGMLWWLWADLGRLRYAVFAYVVTILAMVCSSLALPYYRSPAPVGAILFFASDAILSIQLFKQRFTGRLGQWAVWAFYFVGQLLIATGFAEA